MSYSTYSKRNRGFTAVEAILIIVALVLVAAAGYLVMKHGQDGKNPTASQQAVSATAPAAPKVEDTSDLDSASSTLDQTNVDASSTDLSDLDAQLSGF